MPPMNLTTYVVDIASCVNMFHHVSIPMLESPDLANEYNSIKHVHQCARFLSFLDKMQSMYDKSHRKSPGG